MGNDALALVEESAGNEKPTEHITRLMDAKFLMKELHEAKGNVKRLELELENARRVYGGKKMGRSLLAKAVAVCGIGAALYFGFDSYTAKADNEMLRKTRYSAVERAEANNLMNELEKQVKSADETLESVKKVERNYEVFARDALKYIDDCVPKGELEDHVAEEVAGLRNFFQSPRRDNITGRVKLCKDRYADAKREDLDKSSLRTSVHYANKGYSETMGHYNDRSQTITAWLPRFRKMVEHHPLKGKKHMLARIALQMQSRNTLIKQTAYQQRVFDNNQASYNVIPVEPLKAK